MTPTTQPADLEALAMLERCAEQFAFYERQHRAKGTPDADAKAEVNAGMVRNIRAVLAAQTRAPAVEDGETVERVARAIDPHAWNMLFHPDLNSGDAIQLRHNAKEAARAALAALSTGDAA